MERIIKINDPVYSFSEVMAHIDLQKYFVEQKGRETGRPRYDREKLLKIVLFAFMEFGYCSVRRIQKLCETDIRFLWLLDDAEAPSHMTINNFIHKELSGSLGDIFNDINSYMFGRLDVDLNHAFIAGLQLGAQLMLERQYSFDENGQHDEDNGSESMIIHGDNLEALKSLLPQYEGRVKCIYIDPPYNTGNEGWVYNDNVNDPRIKKWLGEVVGKEGKDLSRHDKWLCMMYPRLKLLQKLLAEDGVIFASLDYHEQPVMRLIMDEVFGASNYVSEIACVNKPSGRSDDKYIANRKMGLCNRS